jgi:phosphoribosylaminoimidazole (AIR) synthetase
LVLGSGVREHAIVDTLLTSSKIDYIYPIELVAMAHITGDGFADNIGRLLPEDLTFRLDRWEFPAIFKCIQENAELIRE